MTKEQIKEFVKTHKKDILIAVGGIAVGSLCGVGVYKHNHKLQDKALNWLIELNYPAVLNSRGVFRYMPDTDVFTMGEVEKAIADLVKEVNDNSIELTGMLVFTKQALEHLGPKKIES